MVRECKQQLFLAKDSVSGAKNRLLSPDPGNKSNTPSVYSWIFLCGSYVSIFVSSDRSSYSDGSLLYVYRSRISALFALALAKKNNKYEAQPCLLHCYHYSSKTSAANAISK